MGLLQRGSAKLAFGLGLTMVLASCGTAPQGPVAAGSAPPAATAPTSLATSPSPTVTPSATATLSTATPTPSGPPIVTGRPGSGPQVLVLADAFNPGEWEEGSFTPANETSAVRAMAIQVYCTTRTPKTLEYRFAQVQGRLAVQVAQDMRSANPDLELEYSLTADGRQVDVKNGDFRGKPELSTNLAGVTVVRIGVRAAPGATKSCNSSASANALITRMAIEQ